MSWTSYPGIIPIFVVWDAILSKPYTTKWDQESTAWDATWDDGATTWEDDPTTWTA